MPPSDSPALSSASGIGEEAGTGYVAATVISYVVNPLVLPPLLFALVLAHVGAPAAEVLRGAGIALLFFCLVPLAYVAWLRLRGVVESLEVRDRSKREGPLLVGLGAGVAAFAAVTVTDTGGALIAALVACHVLNTVLLTFITFRWKISIHCTALAGVVAVLAFVRFHVGIPSHAGAVIGPSLLGGVGLLVPVLAWARVRSGAHTLAQALAGTLFGFLLSYVELYLLTHYGLF